ncbi:MAG: N-acetyl-1-D-myo-inositol-2-amino-2-deoxy-alpha-D-glucopyranoside deacetylase [Nitriliruptorales bacterium]|nr:N-acetyl-1-D-myo-inositol-2-amino-2-deoxy-alpha-D-glucopyranoside deacetylase [Nitriliruptorales bacterium]
MTTLGLMCVHAHPDDESIATGGVLLRAADEGIRTAVVTCTGGERGEIHNMDEESTRPRLAQVRREELRGALAVLGAGEPRFLGYVDSGMMGTEGNQDPTSFWQASLDDAIGRLVAEIRQFQPDVLVAYDAFGGYGHPDHIQTHRVGLLAAEACAVPALYPETGPSWRVKKVYMATLPKSAIFRAVTLLTAQGLPAPFPVVDRVEDVTMGVSDEEVDAVVDVRSVIDRKLGALHNHRSQLDPSSYFLNIPEEFSDQAFGTEWFIRHRSDVPADGVEDDLFAGLRAS